MTVRARLLRALRHPVSQNALALYAVQFGITIVPLLVLPYLARTLGPRELGYVVFVQSFSFLLGLVLEYGFSLSAARRVAQARDDPRTLERVVSGVLGAKLVLAAGALAISLALWPLIGQFRDRPSALAFGFILTVFQGLHPIWFFIGIERLRPTAFWELGVRAVSSVAIVLLVRDPGDANTVLAIYVAAAACTTGGLLALMYRHVRFRAPRIQGVRLALREGATLFLSTAAVSLYTTANVFILGILLPTTQLAFYAAAERLVRAAVRVLGQVGSASYPRVTYLLAKGEEERANRLAALTLGFLGAAAGVATLVLVVFADRIVRLVYGSDYGPAADVLRVLALIILLSAVAATLSTQWLLTRRLDRQVSAAVTLVGALNVVLLLLVVPVGGITGAAWVLVGAETLAVVVMGLLVRRVLRGRPRVAGQSSSSPESSG